MAHLFHNTQSYAVKLRSSVLINLILISDSIYVA